MASPGLEHVGCRVYRAAPRSKLSNEAIVHARKFGLPGLVQSEIGEAVPQRERQIADDRLFECAEPAEETRRQAAWNAVRKQKAKFAAYGVSIV